jgi:hypothetical protein
MLLIIDFTDFRWSENPDWLIWQFGSAIGRQIYRLALIGSLPLNQRMAPPLLPLFLPALTHLRRGSWRRR